MKTKDVIKKELQSRISQVEICLKSAKDCLKDNDFLQCAVRLRMAAEQGRFSDFAMYIFDSLSIQENVPGSHNVEKYYIEESGEKQ